MPPDISRRLRALERRVSPRDPPVFVVELPLAVLRQPEAAAAWLETHGVTGWVVLVPPVLPREEWMARYRPQQDPGGVG